ncbi:hypothetical protein I79_010133 [Cricetulus griseus]|uniref:Uncharacterized protein n=1 Tax=Cricetulus griseus TaxID=10029 RepID=G3HHM9_CRIGR|nr:hypothetical protein I79_010133 [Cricetulus griseus]
MLQEVFLLQLSSKSSPSFYLSFFVGFSPPTPPSASSSNYLNMFPGYYVSRQKTKFKCG